MATVRFDHISHREPGAFDALVGLDLELADHETVVLLGAPGSGAATALRLLAGFEDPDRGTIRIGGRDVAGVPPRERNVALVLPHRALYPHLTVLDHLGFPLVVWGVPDAERRRRVADVAAQLRIGHLLDHRPTALTATERQRVALGRAIVRRPDVLLLDDPFTGLDDAASAAVRSELERLCHDVGTTTLAVVPDRADALALGRRVVHVDSGRCRDAIPSHVPA